MYTPALPSELWQSIFELTTDDEAILRHEFPMAMACSEWFRQIYGPWILRSPQEVLNSLQRKGYATKKAIMLTCRTFNAIGRDFLFRYLFTTSESLPRLRALYDADPTLGTRTLRIHLRSAPTERTDDRSTLADLEALLARCTRLETFVVDGQLSRSAFARIADALRSHTRRTLRALHVVVPTDALPTLIAVLPALPRLASASLAFFRSAPARASRVSIAGSENGDVLLGAAADLALTIPALAQLVLRGPCAQFIEQAAGWALPELTTLTIDPGAERDGLPDVLDFLHAHGDRLEYLELDGPDPVTVATALDLCPLLHTLVLNPDWKLALVDEDELRSPVALLAHRPHMSLARVGLYGLLDAFGVALGPGAPDMLGPGGARLPTPAQLQVGARRRANDALMRALNRENFPELKVVRAVGRGLLGQLERMDGPSREEGCFERWEWWWAHCARAGIRLEDCTGDFLGTLPPKDDDGEEDSEEDSEEGSEEESDEYTDSEEDEEGGIEDLRQLLEECRRMSATRDTDTSMMALYAQMGGMS